MRRYRTKNYFQSFSFRVFSNSAIWSYESPTSGTYSGSLCAYRMIRLFPWELPFEWPRENWKKREYFQSSFAEYLFQKKRPKTQSLAVICSARTENSSANNHYIVLVGHFWKLTSFRMSSNSNGEDKKQCERIRSEKNYNFAAHTKINKAYAVQCDLSARNDACR